MEYFDQFLFVGFSNVTSIKICLFWNRLKKCIILCKILLCKICNFKKKTVLCKIHIPNLAKDFQSETNMPSIKVRQCCDIYPKLSVLKQHGQIRKFPKKIFCKVRFSNLAKDFKSETRMPFMNVHQCRDIYPKLSVLKCCGNFCCFSTFLTTPTVHQADETWTHFHSNPET